MDREISSPGPRSPLSSIGNLLQPTSDEQTLRDSVYNPSAPDLPENERGSLSFDYVTESESPQVQTAKRVYITPLSRLEREGIPRAGRVRSRSLDTHSSTQFEYTPEIPPRMSSLHRTRNSQSHSLDEGQLSSQAFRTLPNDEPINHLSIDTQQPEESNQESSESTSQSFTLIRNSPTGVTQYHIPLPPSTLRERLNSRPSPEQLTEQRRSSTISNETFRQAVTSLIGRVFREVPRDDDEIGVAQPNGSAVGRTIIWTRYTNFGLPIFRQSRFRELLDEPQTQPGIQTGPEEIPRRSRWRRV